ncbi:MULTISPECIES: DUF1150 family protein [Roseobacter]|uniref:DUF1150 family protein n=1 Tax=Roseobacter litoralis (strain ATCC 49566 / DSM 6996 / JCM 21268 / NBRC 15278 / OCh 149) TaxID=391595 RepID=F7ZEF9_ROSLO|nr:MULTISPECIES: DUF1150 family protein [Roseobacter]AEI94672.1 hypothetical protein DUF1150 [Roseobacter litoralis Och 149]GIT87945.1 hypothetical protein ROBYS_29610 [Roseobacter sp. OBYS 0001]
MQEPFETSTRDNRIVYVKAVDVSDLPTEVQGKIEGLEQLYAVHDSDGQQLALVADRKLAFVLARQNDYAPVPVH